MNLEAMYASLNNQQKLKLLGSAIKQTTTLEQFTQLATEAAQYLPEDTNPVDWAVEQRQENRHTRTILKGHNVPTIPGKQSGVQSAILELVKQYQPVLPKRLTTVSDFNYAQIQNALQGLKRKGCVYNTGAGWYAVD